MKIQLIDGPIDGLSEEWPNDQKTKQIRYYGGWATYTLEPPKTEGLKPLTAIYIKG